MNEEKIPENVTTLLKRIEKCIYVTAIIKLVNIYKDFGIIKYI